MGLAAMLPIRGPPSLPSLLLRDADALFRAITPQHALPSPRPVSQSASKSILIHIEVGERAQNTSKRLFLSWVIPPLAEGKVHAT